MKTTAIILSALLVAASALAGGIVFQLSPQLSQSTTVYGGTVISTNFSGTNLTAFTLTSAESVLPYSSCTFNVFFTSGTSANSNSCTVIMDRSADGTYFVPVATNVLASESTAALNTSWEQSFSGKWNTVRFRSTISSTNATLRINYVAQ